MTEAGRPIKVPLQLSEPEALGELTRQVFFSPATTHNRYQKFAVVKGAPGARGAVHTHLGEEVVYTIAGRCILRIDGADHLLEPGTAFLIPPDTEHPAEVVGDEPWFAVAAYCDECVLMKEFRARA
jgi:quercetin dioxygenase-like cupin family protein